MENSHKVIELISIIKSDRQDLYDAFSLLYDLCETDMFRLENKDIPASKTKESKLVFNKVLQALMEICTNLSWPIPHEYPSITMQFINEYDMYHGSLVYDDLAFIYVLFPLQDIGAVQGLDIGSSISSYAKVIYN
jgi:hypothetical protein